MIKSISDKLLSLFHSSASNVESSTSSRKRKLDRSACDDFNDTDPDVQIVRVEKKRKVDNSNTFFDTVKAQASRMSMWLKPRVQLYTEEFSSRPLENSSRWSGSTGSKNTTGPSGGARVNGDDNHMANYRFPERHNLVKSTDCPSNGHNGTSQKLSQNQSKESTASKYYRLKEKEEYSKLLKLHMRSSGALSSIFSRDPHPKRTHHDTTSVSPSNSSFTDSHPSTTRKTSTETRRISDSSQKRQGAANNSSFNISDLRKFDNTPRPPSSLSYRLMQQRKRAGINVDRTDQEVIVIDVDDDEEDKKDSKQSSLLPKAALDGTGSQKTEEQTAPFLRSRLMNDKDVEEDRKNFQNKQALLKQRIEEEEAKAKAYAQKRRAQESSLEKQMKYQMRIFDEEPSIDDDIFLEPEEEVEEEEEIMPGLTRDMEEEISRALRQGNPNDVLSEGFRLQITRRDMATLGGLNWLNDEVGRVGKPNWLNDQVINFYMNMLMARGEQEGKPKVYAFNTFFYPKIMSGGHGAVKRWTKKVDIFAMHFILIPVHLGMHWCLCVVDMKAREITYYDSMGAKNVGCLKAVLEYINDESIVKKGTPINKKEWTLTCAKDNPHQMNGGDCGMFMCKYAEYITRGKPITFTQANMPYFRRRMVYEILHNKLLQ